MHALRSPTPAATLVYDAELRLLLRYGDEPPAGPLPEAPLPDWLDLVICVALPSLTAATLVAVFQAAKWLLA